MSFFTQILESYWEMNFHCSFLKEGYGLNKTRQNPFLQNLRSIFFKDIDHEIWFMLLIFQSLQKERFIQRQQNFCLGVHSGQDSKFRKIQKTIVNNGSQFACKMIKSTLVEERLFNEYRSSDSSRLGAVLKVTKVRLLTAALFCFSPLNALLFVADHTTKIWYNIYS